MNDEPDPIRITGGFYAWNVPISRLLPRRRVESPRRLKDSQPVAAGANSVPTKRCYPYVRHLYRTSHSHRNSAKSRRLCSEASSKKGSRARTLLDLSKSRVFECLLHRLYHTVHRVCLDPIPIIRLDFPPIGKAR